MSKHIYIINFSVLLLYLVLQSEAIAQIDWSSLFVNDQTVATNMFGDHDVHLVDINGDTFSDVVVSAFREFGVLLNDGNGNLFIDETYELQTLSSGSALADVDGDSCIDFVVAGSFSGVRIIPGNGDGTFDMESLYEINIDTSFPRFVLLRDLNQDSRIDLIVRQLHDPMLVLLQQTDGSFFSVGFS